MAANDFAIQTGAEKISTNALATLNGVNIAADLVEVQRVKAGFGADGDFNDVTAASPLPVTVGNFPALQPVSLPKFTTVSAPAQTAIGTAAAQILAATSRKRLIIVNTGLTVIKLALGAAPTQTAYHVALGAASAADNGTGGVYSDDEWVGAVHAISSAAGGTIVMTEVS